MRVEDATKDLAGVTLANRKCHALPVATFDINGLCATGRITVVRIKKNIPFSTFLGYQFVSPQLKTIAKIAADIQRGRCTV